MRLRSCRIFTCILLSSSYGELDEEDCQQVEQLVFCSHPQTAHEAGHFLHERILSNVESSSPSKKKGMNDILLGRNKVKLI